jgi:cardiolipin synthase
MLGSAFSMSGESLTRPAAEVDLLDGGVVAFERILRRIDEARSRIWMRCFDWRDDDTGQAIASALLRAADRGVAVTILKDRMAMHYEYLEATRQSFFHKKIALSPRLTTWLLMVGYGSWGSLRQTASPLAEALTSHANVSVFCEDKRFDHAKLYVFDDERVILGGMGIGDDFRWNNVDFMVEIGGADATDRLAERYAGRATFDPERPFDYLLHSFRAGPVHQGALAAQRLACIAGARERLTIEMAYFGDPRCTDALVEAVKRGVLVTLLTSARANIIADLNLSVCDELLRRTRNAENLRIFLHPRMVHGKAIAIDGQRVLIGSTNFTILSHGSYEEVDLYCRDSSVARAVEVAIGKDIEDASPAPFPIPHRRLYALVERGIVSRQASRSRKAVEAQSRTTLESQTT